MITREEAQAFIGHSVTVELPRSGTGRARYRSGRLDTIGAVGMVILDRADRQFKVDYADVVSVGSSTDGSHWPPRPIVNAEFDELFKPLLAIARGWAGPSDGLLSARNDEGNGPDPVDVVNDITQTVIRWIERFPALDDLPDPDALPLELCTGDTDQCPHYGCPDGFHGGMAPNCSCTPDCAEEDEDEDDGKTLIAGVLYDNETGEEADPQ